MHTQIKAGVFDAYGTLFDPLSVQKKAERTFPGRGEALSRLWRSRQLEYTWLRALMNDYADFWQVTREALAYACRSLGLRCAAAQQEELMQEYLHLEVYPDVTVGLEAVAKALGDPEKPFAVMSVPRARRQAGFPSGL
jgi:2-haloacid dehalogenase